MTTYVWAKMWIDTLDDHKVGQLSDHLWRRFFEFVLLAKEQNESGYLPTVSAMAWRLRTSAVSVEDDLRALAETKDDDDTRGLVRQVDGRWYVTNFVKRQEKPMTDAERKEAQRERERKADPIGQRDSDVTDTGTPVSRDCHETVTTCDTEEKKKRKEVEEEERVPPVVVTPELAPIEPSPEPPTAGGGGDISYPTITQSEVENPPERVKRQQRAFQDEMRLSLSGSDYEAVIQPMRLVRVDDGAAILAISSFRYDLAVRGARRLERMIRRTLGGIIGHPVAPSYVRLDSTPDPVPKEAPDPVPKEARPTFAVTPRSKRVLEEASK